MMIVKKPYSQDEIASVFVRLDNIDHAVREHIDAISKLIDEKERLREKYQIGEVTSRVFPHLDNDLGIVGGSNP